ncbi:hypothetical protein P3W43_08910 [Salinicola salarius]|uniref:hypothetical protein n=1 Tax=Salinicola salarius TaxID=430457 RepID=UPI0023E43C50|nr:hypothetical protein [Salinicola salarius]MDF3918980.1 hypothetical protein [Salinicola salarius]
MPKPLTAVVIRRSRLSLGFQLLLAGGVALYASWWIDWRVAAIIAVVAIAAGYRHYLETPKRLYLRCTYERERPVWESSIDARTWQTKTCRLIRLGPLLSAIDLSGRRVWLWPDSSDVDSLRHLRETLAEQVERADFSS